MSTVTGRPARRTFAPRTTALLAAFALSVLGLVTLPSTAQAATTGTVTSGTTSWGISSWLNAPNFGRINPLASAYTSPATFTADTAISTWGAGTGTVAADGSAELAFAGESVNFSPTGGGWFRFKDLQATLDEDGNGTVSALVSYGLAPGAYPNITYDPAQAPQRGPVRVDIMDLSANTAADLTRTSTTAAWAGLDGDWSDELLAFFDGDATATPAIPAFTFKSGFTGTVNSGPRPPSPFAFSVATVAPAVTYTTTSTKPSTGATLAVSGTGFSATDGNPGDDGVYVGVAPAGDLPPVDTQEGQENFLASAWVPGSAIQDGAFATSLQVPKADLDPTVDYAIFTWRAHGYSTESQNTQTPVEFDYDALTKAELTVSLPTAAIYGVGRTAKATSAVADGDIAPTGDVVAKIGTKTVGTGALDEDGVAAVVLDTSIAVGTRSIVFSYAGDDEFTAADPVEKSYKVSKGTATSVGFTTTTKPTATKTGKGTIKVAVPTGAPAATGTVKVTYTKSGTTDRYVTGSLSGGSATLTLPKLPKGTWKVFVKYGGSSSYNQVATLAKGTITIK